MRPLAIDLYCGLGGWTEGLLAEGYDVIGFDIERHVYGEHRYPAQLVIQDVLALHGSQFRSASLIVASPPCQEFSYMAMPWSIAKAKAKAIRADATGEMLANLTALFDACFRIQTQASLAAGRHIPMVVENVRGAQPWVGRARWMFGSFALWGDVPALMPASSHLKEPKVPRVGGIPNNAEKPGYVRRPFNGNPSVILGIKSDGGGGPGFNVTAAQRFREGTKNGGDWFGSGENCSLQRRQSSSSNSRKAASAIIAKIPLPLSRHIAATFKRPIVDAPQS